MSDLKKLLQVSKDFAVSEAKEYQLPSLFHLELAYKKGQWLAKELEADREIVAIGTYLMDCMLGLALKEGRLQEHVKISRNKAKEIINKFSLENEVSENILACVSQHHGVDKFFSLESEICCNADCYRFVSIEGFIGGIHNSRQMPVDEILDLYDKKADEKWSALTLKICKRDLESEYKVIKKLIKAYKQ